MDNIYLLTLIALFGFAISDLVVGVSNDAVNFLNPSVGSKVAPRNIILLVACIGVIFGATFSSGMMEVARKGIFNPDRFYYSEVMIIFLAVAIADVILLDMFNTLGLPTSTTVSVIFELLGAALGIAAIKVMVSPTESFYDIAQYINSGKAMTIIGGILISIIVAIIVGMLVQYLVRLIFSFRYDRTIKYFGGIWGGLSISFIIYFILVKGAKGASFIPTEFVEWIENNTFKMLLYCFLFCASIFQLIVLFTKFNILRIVVLFGTFALAMAFAGNDLVNFIGVTLAGLKSYQVAQVDPLVANNLVTMEVLKQPVQTNTYLLLAAGIVMTLAIWFSKKARTVTKTEINLSRQGSGEESFGSSIISRAIVRWALNVGKIAGKIVPNTVSRWVDKRFQGTDSLPSSFQPKGAPFDLVRASVNLTVSTVLIAFATSLKLPLSTTYVTFMVAMGSSLSDRAWGRETAVYRITGVFTVISGWFFTAFLALTLALIMAVTLYFGGIYALFGLILLAVLFVIRTHYIHKKREEKLVDIEYEGDASVSTIDKCLNRSKMILSEILKIYPAGIRSWITEDRKTLKKVFKDVESVNFTAKKYKENVHKTIEKLLQESYESGHYYVQAVDYQREIAHNISFIIKPILEHVENNHQGLSKDQEQELADISGKIVQYYMNGIRILESKKLSDLDDLFKAHEAILHEIDNSRKKQIKRIKKEKISIKNSLLFFNILNETKNLILNTTNLLKAERDFINEAKITG